MSSLFLIVSHEMFGTGVGFCTNAVTGQCLPFVLSEGLPEWSLEHKTSSSASEPSSGTPGPGALEEHKTSSSASEPSSGTPGPGALVEHKTSSSASEPSSGTPSLGHQLPSVNCDKSALAAGAKRPRELPPLSSESGGLQLLADTACSGPSLLSSSRVTHGLEDMTVCLSRDVRSRRRSLHSRPHRHEASLRPE